MLRPDREAMAIVGGTANIPWLWTGTFVAMIMATPVFGWVASRFPRKTFLPWVYYFFIFNIMIFFAVFSYTDTHEMNQVWIARSFFVWLSVFNLFVVSVFWSFMADIYSKEQCRRLFGVITAGGSTGAFLGGIITGVLVVPIGFKNLLPMSALLLLVAVFCVYRLRRWTAQRESGASRNDVETDSPLGGNALEGIRRVFTSPYFSAIAMALVLANFLGGVMYFYMAEMVSLEYPNTDAQTRVFALLNTLTTAFAFVGQLLIVRHSVRRFGVGTTLAVMPLIAIVGFAVLAINPTFIVLAALQVLMRSVGFGLTKPTSDMLYSVVSPEARYKAKNFIDTAVYRGADLAAIWSIRLMGTIGMGLGAVSVVCVPLAIAWVSLSLWIGRQYNSRDQQRNRNQTDAVTPS
jgi:AAA family ATP:ADP antiporter